MLLAENKGARPPPPKADSLDCGGRDVGVTPADTVPSSLFGVGGAKGAAALTPEVALCGVSGIASRRL
jgi:hypothetical protein